MSDDQPELTLFEGVLEDVDVVHGGFEPARLTQARVLAWMTKGELAEEVGVSPAAIGQYEAGAHPPRPDLLPKLAKVLGFPVKFFATGRPLGRVDTADAHFRSLRSTRAKDRAKAAVHAEQVWELAFALERRVQFPEVDLPEVPPGTSPADAAEMLRKHWGIKRGPVKHLVANMESRGIVVSLISLTNEAVTRVKAYSTDVLGRPLVIVTPERFKSVYEFRFTCAHELGHLLMHPEPLPGDKTQEREADQFAAAFLTPRAEIEPQLPRRVQLAKLEELSRAWGVSVRSLIYRMGELQIVSESSIRRAYQRLAKVEEFGSDEPLSMFPGEIPMLLREAIELAAGNGGFDRIDLANELCWTESHLAEVLGEEDSRPRLRLV